MEAHYRAGPAIFCGTTMPISSVPRVDGSWAFSSERIHVSGGMRLYGKVLKKRDYRLRLALRIPVMQWLLRGFINRLASEDVLYIHNRPEYVLAIRRHFLPADTVQDGPAHAQ